MTRKKGEEPQLQENSSSQTTRASKEKGNQVAATAAAKLEKFAHPSTSSSSPSKNIQHQQDRLQAGDRKSLGKGPATTLTTKAANSKSLEGELAGSVNNNAIGHNAPGEAEPTLKDVLCAVNSCKASLSELCTQLTGLKDELITVSQELQSTISRTTTLEERVSQAEDDLNPLKQELKALKMQIDLHNAKFEEMENRSRRNNVRVVGLPERCEGSHPEEFFENWLRGIFGAETFSHLFSIERAHRVPTRTPSTGGYPRPIIIKLINYRDKVTLMRRARELGDILYNGTKILFFPDYSPDLQKRRAEFRDIKRNLRNYKLEYALLYPARLRIVALGSTHYFDTTTGATKWLEDNKKDLLS